MLGNRNHVVETDVQSVCNVLTKMTKGMVQQFVIGDFLTRMRYLSDRGDTWLVLCPGDSPSKLVGIVQAIGPDVGINPKRVFMLPFVMSGSERTPCDERSLRALISMTAKHILAHASDDEQKEKPPPVRVAILDVVISGTSVDWVWDQVEAVHKMYPDVVSDAMEKSLELAPYVTVFEEKPNLLMNLANMYNTLFDNAERHNARCMPHEPRVRLVRPEDIGENCKKWILLLSAWMLLKHRRTVPKGLTQRMASSIIEHAARYLFSVSIGQLSAAMAFFRNLQKTGGEAEQEHSLRKLEQAQALLGPMWNKIR